MNNHIGSVQPVVLLKSLSKSRIGSGGGTVLDRIDARIDAGECVALMGPSVPGQIDSDEHYRLSGSARRATYLFCGREVGRLDDDELSRIRKSRIGFRGSRTSIFCRD